MESSKSLISTVKRNNHVVHFAGKLVKSVTAFEEPVNSFSVARDFSMLLATSGEGAKLFDPDTLDLIKNFKTEVPMNAGSISPLIYDKKEPKYHAIIGGGVQAIDAAKHRVRVIIFSSNCY